MKGEPPTGLIRTLPAIYANRRHEACKNYLAAIERMSTDEDAHWFVLLPSRPKTEELLHVYIVIAGKIDHRFTFAGFRDTQGDATLWDGTIKGGKNVWAIVAGPAEKPPREIPYRGFRGFRYTPTLW